MTYNFNGTELQLKDKLCRLWEDEHIDIPGQTNLYIRISNTCNANCKFCEYHGDSQEFNIDALEKILNELRKRDIIYKIQITGGETTLDSTRLQQVVKLVRKYFEKDSYFLGINSNGYDLQAVLSIKDKIDNIAISRHHYDDKVNREIFSTDKIPGHKELAEFIQQMTPEKVHLSCNLMKSYIGKIGSIKRYLDFCIDIGCRDVGFVTLMPINNWAKSEQVLFDNCGIEEDDSFLKYKQYTKCGDCCRCANYLYFSKKKMNMVDVYGRFVSKPDNTTGLISFDGKALRVGFNGAKISI